MAGNSLYGNYSQWRTQKIFMGGFIQWHMVVISIWCALFVTSQSCFQTNVLATFVDIICIFFYIHSPYLMRHCTEYKLLALQVRISEETKLYATTQQFITAKISGCVLNEGSKTLINASVQFATAKWGCALFRPPLEYFHPSLQRHNSPANSVRELFKSSTDLASLLISIKKIYISFGLGVLLGGRHKVGVFLKFWPTSTFFWLLFYDVITRTMSKISGSKYGCILSWCLKL